MERVRRVGAWRKRRTKNPQTIEAVERPVVKHLLPFFAHSDPARARQRLLAAGTPIWPSATGERRDRHSVRARLLAPVIEKARRTLEASGDAEPLPERVTPHTFRRTAATYWFWLGRDERATMHEIGHKSSQLTLEVYAQARPRDKRQREMLACWFDGVEI